MDRPTDTSRAEIAETIRDLLRIAKVAMPPKLYGEDPRVTRATALLTQLTGASTSRPPSVGVRRPRLDLTTWAQRRAVEESTNGVSFIAELPWDLIEIMAGMEELPLDPSDAVAFIVREWLTSTGRLHTDNSDLGPH